MIKKVIAMAGAGALMISGLCFAESTSIAGSYLFASGAGAWGTEMVVEDDGSFAGNYSDSEMGDTGDEYEYGSCYVCSFTGKFSQPEDQGSGVLCMTVESLEYAVEPGTETIEDEVRYVYDEAYGVSLGDTFYYYPAGYPTDQLDESALEWASMTGSWEFDAIPETLPYALFYNMTQGYAFSQE